VVKKKSEIWIKGEGGGWRKERDSQKASGLNAQSHLGLQHRGDEEYRGEEASVSDNLGPEKVIKGRKIISGVALGETLSGGISKGKPPGKP